MTCINCAGECFQKNTRNSCHSEARRDSGPRLLRGATKCDYPIRIGSFADRDRSCSLPLRFCAYLRTLCATSSDAGKGNSRCFSNAAPFSRETGYTSPLSPRALHRPEKVLTYGENNTSARYVAKCIPTCSRVRKRGRSRRGILHARDAQRREIKSCAAHCPSFPLSPSSLSPLSSVLFMRGVTFRGTRLG